MRSKYLSAIALLSIAVAACGGGKDGGPTYASSVDSATAAGAGQDAANFASDLADNMVSGQLNTDIGSLIPFSKGVKAETYAARLIDRIWTEAYRRAHRTAPAGSPMAHALQSAAPFSECVPTITGIDADSNAIDTDDDGIPDDLKITFPANCISEDSTSTTQYSGSVELKDLTGLYAYRLNAGNFKVKFTDLASGDFNAIGVNGFETATYSASAISHQTNLTYTLSFSGSGAPAAPVLAGPQATAPVTGSISFVYIETTNYAPDGTISVESPIPSGDLTFTFDYRILASETGQPDQNFRFTMSTTTQLHYDNSGCEGVVSGVVRGLLNGNANVGFDVTWTGCGTYTVTTFGTTEATS